MWANTPAGAIYETLVQQHFRSTLPYWEDIYTDTTVYSRIYQERAQRAIACLDQLDLPFGSPVLEIGCGPGVITGALARKGFRVSAIDTVPEMVERTRAKSQTAGLNSNIFARVGNIESLPFDDVSFDAVMVIGVSEWLLSLKRPLEEIHRVLRPGAHLIISADNNWPLQQILDPVTNPILKPIKGGVGRILRITGLRPPQPRFHAYSLQRFDRELNAAGFEKINGQTLGFGPLTFFNRKLLNEKIGWKLHLALQKWADIGVPFVRSAGLVYLVLARKSRQ